MWNVSSRNDHDVDVDDDDDDDDDDGLGENNSNNQEENNLNENDLDRVNHECYFEKSRPLSKAAQQILVPNFFSVVASILTYFLVGITSSFDSIRVYCIFTSKFYLFFFLLFKNSIHLIKYTKKKKIHNINMFSPLVTHTNINNIFSDFFSSFYIFLR